eukprot:g42829.t1
MQNLVLRQIMRTNIKEDLQKVKSHQALIFVLEASKIIFHSRIHPMEQVEMCLSFFFQKLSSLKEDDDSTMSSQSDILRISHSFYARLYNTKPTDSMAFRSFLSFITEVLDDRTQESLSLDELTKVVESLEKNKTHRSDSLLTELYSTLWGLIGQDCWRHMLLAGSTCKSMRKGIITLIYKWKGEREQVRNWQPISLLNVDYKILSNAIANWARTDMVWAYGCIKLCIDPWYANTKCHYVLMFYLTLVLSRLGLASLSWNAEGSWTALYHLSPLEKFAKMNTFDHKSI